MIKREDFQRHAEAQKASTNEQLGHISNKLDLVIEQLDKLSRPVRRRVTKTVARRTATKVPAYSPAPATVAKKARKTYKRRCKDCGAQFTGARGLGIHRSMVHGVPGQLKSYNAKTDAKRTKACPNCGKMCVPGRGYKVHAATHKN